MVEYKMLTKIKIAIGVLALVTVTTLFALWRVSESKYNAEKSQKESLQAQLVAAQKENANLIAYNKKITIEMEKIEKEYQKRFQDIPSDTCGDSKPTSELLEYLKKGA